MADSESSADPKPKPPAARGIPYAPPAGRAGLVPPTPPTWPPSASELPTVSVVVLNYNGLAHFATCLESLRALDYPSERFEVIVVDHASVDGSTAAIRAEFPEVRLIEAGLNLGFAAGCNYGARASSADLVAFLNNDARVDPGWLRALVGGLDPASLTVCAAAILLDWDGKEVDFVEGHVAFHGFARQTHWRERWSGRSPVPARELLFACGGAMLIDRAVFLDIGGFDERFWMFFEDVDLGWRLWLSGYRVMLVPEALTYHKHHGSAGRLTMARRTFLYERNALFMIVKNYGEEHVWKALAASLALLGHRVGDYLQRASGGHDLLDPERWHELRGEDMDQRIDLGNLAPLVALRDVVRQLPELLDDRRRIQAGRRRTDEEVLPLLGQPRRLYPMAHMRIQPYCEAHQHLWFGLGLDATFAHAPVRVALLCGDGLPSLGLAAGAEGRTADGIAAALEAAGHDVVPCLPRGLVDAATHRLPERVQRFAWNDRSLDNRLIRLGPDVVIASHWRNLAFARLSIYRPVVLLWSDEDPMPAFEADLAELYDRDAERSHVRRMLEEWDYLRNADLFVFRDDAQRGRAMSQMERRIGWRPPEDRTLLAGPGGREGELAAAEIDAFCRRGWYSDGKLAVDFRPPVPHTPISGLPAKAMRAIRRGGPARLGAELSQYGRWLWHNLRRLGR